MVILNRVVGEKGMLGNIQCKMYHSGRNDQHASKMITSVFISYYLSKVAFHVTVEIGVRVGCVTVVQRGTRQSFRSVCGLRYCKCNTTNLILMLLYRIKFLIAAEKLYVLLVHIHASIF